MEEYRGDGAKARAEEWTDSVAVGSWPFVEKVKALLGFRARGREVIEGAEGYQVREEGGTYNALFEAQKGDIGPPNADFWETCTE